MEELKELIDLISKLPELAIWVLVAFWVYKVIVIGSIFGIIKLGIVSFRDWLMKDKVVITKFDLGGIWIQEHVKNEFAEVLTFKFGTANPTNSQVRELIKQIREMK